MRGVYNIKLAKKKFEMQSGMSVNVHDKCQEFSHYAVLTHVKVSRAACKN